MRTRLLAGTLLLTVGTIVAFFVPAAVGLAAAEREAQVVELQREASDAAARLGERQDRIEAEDLAPQEDDGEESEEHEAEESADHEDEEHEEEGDELDGHEFGLYDPSGVLVLGTGPATADAPVREALTGRSTTGRVGDMRVAAVPVHDGGAVRAAEPAAEADARTRAALLRLAGAALLILVAASVAAWLLARRLTRPLEDVGRTASRLGGGDFTARAEPTGIAEVDDLAVALNQSAARIGDLVDRERRLTADASHQLRTPLAGLRLALEAERAAPRPDRSEVLDESLQAVERMEATVEALTDLARDVPAGEPTPLGPVVEAAVDRWRPLLEGAERSLDVDGAGDLMTTAREAALATILDVLLDNALHHGRGATTVHVAPIQGGARIEISDEGRCDTPAEVLFSRRQSGAGRTGIGLHLARTLAEAEGARLRLSAAAPTTFQVLVPR